MGQVCGTSIGLSWLFASLAHTSLPDVPKNLEENDFNAHKVFRYLDNWTWNMRKSIQVIEQLEEVVDLGPRPVGSQANLQAVQIIKCLPAFNILQTKSDIKKHSRVQGKTCSPLQHGWWSVLQGRSWPSGVIWQNLALVGCPFAAESQCMKVFAWWMKSLQ